MAKSDSKVLAFSDGSALGNPGPGGYGVVLTYRGTTKELSRGYRYTTNNRMELLGAIVALETLKRRCSVRADDRFPLRRGWNFRRLGREMACQRLEAGQAREGTEPRSVGEAAQRGFAARRHVQLGSRTFWPPIQRTMRPTCERSG